MPISELQSARVSQSTGAPQIRGSRNAFIRRDAPDHAAGNTQPRPAL
jgi:hypothetical protein